ncbi:hypothetical protein [Mycobacteroides abscessus]|uniref:hypothetical protein n=1 Tax=Mycobacteroides abscessus TaxID=36809 RepID=UPI0009A5D954|nr:hypothetical protein [Mycobacteroides abscessus]RIS77933.1 hypothetical protein D2E54_15385 [Mycobacteroides abscessus]SKQ72977.1 Uncharacterised protein [Mycobacteroides abscessus subsp. massiliense]
MNTEPKPPLPLRNPAQGHAEALMLAQRLYGPKPDEHRDRWRKDLSGRAALVLADGWEPYKHVWSSGEVVGVAALLHDHGMLREAGETLQTAWRRWSFDLFGRSEAEHDAANGYARTRQWFAETAAIATTGRKGG